MRLIRAIAMVVVLGLLLVGSFREPVHAVSSCEDDCATTYSTCNNQVYNDYQTCMGDCDSLYPWWSGCQNYCLGNRDAGWAQCENDYNACLGNCP
jgi:hypothetical protein